MKRYIVTALLILALLVGQTGGALAAPSILRALERGREAEMSISLEWNGIPALGEETNRLIAEIMDAAELRFFIQGDEDGGYAGAELLLSGKVALAFAGIADAEAAYFRSNLLGEPVVVFKPEEILALVNNLRAYLLEYGYIDAQADAEIGAVIERFRMGVDSGLNAFEGFDVEDGLDALEDSFEGMRALLEKRFRFSPAEGFASRFDVDLSNTRAERMALDNAQIAALFADAISEIEQNETIWNTLTNLLTSVGAGAEIGDGIAGIRNQLASYTDADYPFAEPSSVEASRALDLRGDVRAMQVDVTLAEKLPENAAYAPSAVNIALEWVKEPMCVYAGFESNAMGVALTHTAAPAQVSYDDVGGKSTSNRSETVLNIADGYSDFFLRLDTQSAAYANESQLVHGFSQVLTTDLLGGQDAGYRLNADTMVLQDGIELVSNTTAQIGLFAMDEDFDMLTIHIAFRTNAPKAPFETASALNPARMDAEAFAKWIDVDVIGGFVEAIQALITLIPEDMITQLVPAPQSTTDTQFVVPQITLPEITPP